MISKYKYYLIAAIIIIVAILIFIYWEYIKYYLFGGTQIGSKFSGTNSVLPDKLKYDNNVLNIRYSSSNDWKGLTGQKNGFCLFNNVENCIRAGSKILDSYYSRNIKTVSQIITTYAPPIENNTNKYITDVCFLSGLNPNTLIDNFDLKAKLLRAMSIIEVGEQNVPSIKVYQFAVKLK